MARPGEPPGRIDGAAPRPADGPAAPAVNADAGRPEAAPPSPDDARQDPPDGGGAPVPPAVYSGEATSPRLPVLLIDASQRIVDSPKVTGRLRVIEDHDGPFKTAADLASRPVALDSPVGVSLRGATSLTLPQSSYSLELRDAAGKERRLSVLGMPGGEDWAVVACWVDKTCMRNAIGHALGREPGRWNPRTRFVEVFVNDK